MKFKGEEKMLKISNVQITYDDFVLGPISLKIKAGEFISLVGESGSGKSTLIKIISGLIKYEKGNIDYGTIQDENISYISQRGTTFNHLTIKENLNLKYSYSDQEIIKCLKSVNLSENYLNKYPFELSGGERQRIDLTRALLAKSELIILDESMSALDRQNKSSITELLVRFVEENQITVLYITHDLDQANDYSTRIIELNNGQVIKDKQSNLKEPLCQN